MSIFRGITNLFGSRSLNKPTKNVLLITQKTEGANCGIGIIGKLIGKALSHSKKYNFVTVSCSDMATVDGFINDYRPIAIIYNYHDTTTPWMIKRSGFLSKYTPWVKSAGIISKYPQIKHIMLHHDFHQEKVDRFSPSLYHGFEYIICADPTLVGSDHVFPVNRLIPDCSIKPYVEKDRPVIGFQGFGAVHKGIHKIALKTVEEFDAAIINLHIPPAHWGTPLEGAIQRVNEVKAIVNNSGKKNIDVVFSHDILSTQDLISTMSQNTVNCYFNDYLDGAGLASSPDYALSARRPIALTKSHQFRNFLGITPSVFIEDNSLKDIISFGTDHLQGLYGSYSQSNVIEDYEKVIDKVT